MNKIKIIIGINANHADSSACILVDGKIIAAIEEERINRKKHFSGFPIESIKECLKIANKKDIEITDIAFNTKPSSNFISKALFLLKNFSFKKNYFIKRINNKTEGMTAYSKIQELEFAREKDGYTSVKHQREVGTSYFDAVSNTISSGKSSTTAMAGSTESEQF